MYLSNVLAASAFLPAVIEAHGGLPQLLSARSVKELKARSAFGHLGGQARHHGHQAEKRQVGGTSGMCGPGVGSCAAGYCCSPAGWCGLTEDYCEAPDCQFNYGSGCDTLKVPPGPTTSGIARTKIGSVPYGGVGIYDCTTIGTVALTFDDGPWNYTSDLLDLLDAAGVKATFFVTGNNNGKGQIDDPTLPWSNIIKRMYSDGHQIASHTWGHQDLSNITQAQRKNQMYYNEMAFNNILGLFPTYMRPPYSSCTSACEADMATLGYHIVYFDLDTEDYLHDDPNQIQISKNDFSGNLSTETPTTGDFLVISHDIHYQTVYNLTQFMLNTISAKGWKPVTVGQCLGDPAANWYRKGSGPVNVSSSSSSLSSHPATSSTSIKSSTIPVSTSLSSSSSAATASPSAYPVSTDATCGATAKKTCLGSTFGNCCSVNGWCGSTAAYCGTSCLAGYGSCGTQSVSVSSQSVSSQSAGSPSGSPVAKVVSTDGSCGGTAGYTCQGSTFGTCCSQYGWCGSTTNYCSTGCNAAFGTCSASVSQVSSSLLIPTSSAPASTKTSSSSSKISLTKVSTPTQICLPIIGCFKA